jgi:hypothetical protein
MFDIHLVTIRLDVIQQCGFEKQPMWNAGSTKLPNIGCHIFIKSQINLGIRLITPSKSGIFTDAELFLLPFH